MLVAFKAFFPAFGLLGALAGPVLVDEGFFFFDLLLLLFESALLVAPPFGAQLAIFLVVARILDHLAGFQLVNHGYDPIEHPAVVADKNHRPGILAEELFQPLSARDVEVVGRLIEQQHVRLGQQQLRQRESVFLAAGKIAHFDLERFVAEPESVQGFINLVIDGIAAGRLNLLFELFVALHQLFELIAVGLGHLGGDLLDLVVQRAQRFKRPARFVAKRGIGVEVRVLGQIAGGGAARQLHLPLVGAVAGQAGDELQKRGFAAAVAADEADVLAAIDREVDPIEHAMIAVAEGHVRHTQ